MKKLLYTLLFIGISYSIFAQTGELLPDDFRYTEIGPNLNTSYDAGDPDIAYNSTDDEYLLVFSADRATVVGEDEIFGQRIDASTGAKVGSEFRISFVGPDGDVGRGGLEPSVSFNSITNEYLVVWHGDNNTAGKEEIYGQRVNSVGVLVGTNFQISQTPGGTTSDALDSKVTTNTTTGNYLVTWTAPDADGNKEIFAQLVSSTGTLLNGGLGAGAAQITKTTNIRAEFSAITYNSTTNEYLVVFRYGLSSAEYNIYAQRLKDNGTLIGSSSTPIQITNVPIGNDAGAPDVAYNATENKYFVVWEENTTSSGEFEIFGQHLATTTALPEGGVGNSTQISEQGTPTNGLQADVPKVVWNSTVNQYLVIWRAEENNNAYEIYVEALDASNLATIEDDVIASSMGSVPTSSTYSVISFYNVAYSTTSRRYLMVWEADDDDAPTANGEFEIFGQQWEVFESPQIAITEWISNPVGTTDNTDEWIEIYNYGTTAVDIQNWRLKDEDTNNSRITNSSLIIPAGGYLILARNKPTFEAQWLNGCASDQVVQVGFGLANKADEIILEDASGNIVWSVAYQNDETAGRATHYTETTYTNTVWGSKATPGIVRNGNDVTGTLGYQKNNRTADPLAVTSTKGDQGSPLNGNLTGGADIVRGNALTFDGIDDLVDMGNPAAFNITNNITLETWAKLEVTGGDSKLITKFGDTANDDAYSLQVVNGFPEFLLKFSGTWVTLNAGMAIVPGRWYHITGVYDGTNMRTYINGIQTNSITQTGTIDVSSATFKLGAWSAGNYLEGQMDEVRVWSVARTADQIRENMHLTLDACGNTGLVAYYQMNHTAGATTVVDVLGNNGLLDANVNATTAWVASGVNVGNDVTPVSNSETILNVPAGTSIQNFVNTNLSLEFFRHTVAEDFTVTYQAYTPNTTNGVVGVNIIQNPVWTVNKSELAFTSNMLANYTFTLPTAFTSTDATKYRLYWRPMYSDEAWTNIATASNVTTNTVTFNKISETGQFMVVQASEVEVSDIRGEMYTFDGSEFIDCSSTSTGLPQGNAPRTMEAWIKTTQTSIGNIISWGRRANNQRNAMAVRGGRLGFIGESNDVNGSTIINDGQWHHVAITHDGTTVRFYVDGVENGAFSRTFNTTDQNLRIGTISLPSSGENYIGSLDEVRIWDVARTQNEIRENRHLTLKGNEAGLVAYFQFNNDDPIGTTDGVKDAMKNSDGTTINMETTDREPSEVAVAGGTSDRVIIGAGGVYTFPNTAVQIEFGANTPNGELVISRLETEKPTGSQTIGGDVDDEYFVVNNYGSNQIFDILQDLTINRMGYVAPSDAFNPCTNLTIYKRPSNAFGGTWGSARGCADNATAGTAGMASYGNGSGITTFSQLVTVNNGTASDLPVELLSFEVERTSISQVNLTWSTATETNNKGFEIQRLFENQTNFETIGWVAGKGTTLTTSFYTTTDENGYEGKTYYRLKQIDFDGTFTYSDIRSVDGLANTSGGIDIYPNPTNDELNIRIKGSTGTAQVQVFNSQGASIYQKQAIINQSGLTTLYNLKALAKGVYVVQLTTIEGEVYTQKFIKK